MSSSELMITSLKNPHIKMACDLRDRRHRDLLDLFIVEGYRELRQYLRASAEGGDFAPLQKLFYCSECFLGSSEEELIQVARASGAEIVRTSSRVFQRLSYRDRPDGLLGIAKQLHRSLDDLVLKDPPFVVIAEGIEKPGNLGTLLRCGDAADIDALILSERRTDLWNPNAVRASVGTLFSVPVAETKTAALHRWLRSKRLKIIAATPEGSVSPSECDFCAPCALMLGSEQFGLSTYWREHADSSVAIAMRGSADSLNIAIAGALLFYEALRQRGKNRV